MPDRAFAADLDSLRLDAGLSLRALVKSSGIPRSTLSDALAGRRFPRLDTVLAVVRACGADPDPWRRRWAAMNRQERLHDPATQPGTTAVPVPAQLPRDVPGFASREAELARLDRAGVAVIHGRPGVGKTALAVRWAHSVAARYPDGQLFVNLRGHHPRLDPMSPAEALGRLLGSLGMSWVPVTDDPDEGTGLWRSTVAGRRLLIVLDDAVTAGQVRPLLPGGAACTVVVTSRRHLADLVVRDGAEGIVLDVLPAHSSVALLGQVAGASRAQAEPHAVAAVAAACGHLPLALRLAGAMLVGAPQRRFAELVAGLTVGDRLTVLEGLARPSAVEAAFELSYRLLAEDARLVFRRLGLHPGPDFDAQVAALLSGIDVDSADRHLHTLAEAHLVEPVDWSRYRMHDLLRDYATRLVDAADGGRRDAARRRLCDWYVDRALAVSACLDKGRERLWAGDGLRSSWEPSPEAAAAWVEAERANVIALIEDDARRGSGQHAWALIDLLAGVLIRRSDASSLVVATDAGLAAAQRQRNRHAEGAIYLRRGWLRWHGRQVAGAASDFGRARTLLHDSGVPRGEASALRGLSLSHADAGRLAEGRRNAEAALAIYQAQVDRFGQAASLSNLAFITSRAADFTASITYMEASLVRHRDGGNPGYVASALANLAHVCLIRGEIRRAVGCAEEAVATARRVGDGVGETTALVNAALAHEQAGSLGDAHHAASAALARAQEMGYRIAEAVAWDTLATVSRWYEAAEARSRRDSALRLIRRIGDLVMEAEILVGVARDAYQHAARSTSHVEPAFQLARQAAVRALDAALAAENPHAQAESRCLVAACDLGLGKVADALVEARQAVEMHVVSGARLAEITARCVLAHGLHQDDDPPGADVEWRLAAEIVDQLRIPDAAPVRQMLDGGFASPYPPVV